MPPTFFVNMPHLANAYARMVAPIEARIQAKIETVPTSASVAGRRIIPEPIMLMAVTVVSCTTPIFLLLDKVCSLLS